MAKKRFFLGLDLGQAQDSTAWSVVERAWEPNKELHLRHLQRAKLGTSYPAIVQQTYDMLARQPLQEQTELIVDATGVGMPVVDLLRDALREMRVRPIAVIVTGGTEVTRDGNTWKIPKRELISGLQVLLQNGRLKIAEKLPEAEKLAEEMQNYRVRIDLRTAHDSYEPWREGLHDDLLFATALAAWFGKKAPPSGEIIIPGTGQHRRRKPDDDPFDYDNGRRGRGWM